MNETPNPDSKIDPIRPTDADAIMLAKRLVRTARFGALAVLDPATGAPMVSRVATATDCDGSPVVLVSELSPHTGAMRADPRVSLLLGEPGKGDPLAHPRITLSCEAVPVDRQSDGHRRVQNRYLNRHPKAKLYAGFGDFGFFRLTMRSGSLNGGFGKAYRLTRADIETTSPAISALAEMEQSAIDHLNSDHRETVRSYAVKLADAPDANWHVTGIDPDGLDLTCGDKVLRLFFNQKLNEASELRDNLAELTEAARLQSDEN